MDTALVERARDGDRDAFAALADGIVDRFLAIAQGVLGDRQLAEDAAQQALIDVWRNLPRLRAPDRFEGWSYRVVVNACYSEVRRSRRWMPDSVAPLAVEPVAADEFAAVHDRDELERAFRDLSIDHRATLVLHHALGLTIPEVARSLEIPEGTVRSRLYHAMKKLRAALRQADQQAALRPGTERAS